MWYAQAYLSGYYPRVPSVWFIYTASMRWVGICSSPVRFVTLRLAVVSLHHMRNHTRILLTVTRYKDADNIVYQPRLVFGRVERHSWWSRLGLEPSREISWFPASYVFLDKMQLGRYVYLSITTSYLTVRLITDRFFIITNRIIGRESLRASQWINSCSTLALNSDNSSDLAVPQNLTSLCFTSPSHYRLWKPLWWGIELSFWRDTP